MLTTDIKLEIKALEDSLIGLKENFRKMKEKDFLSFAITMRNLVTRLINAIGFMVFLQTSSSPEEGN